MGYGAATATGTLRVSAEGKETHQGREMLSVVEASTGSPVEPDAGTRGEKVDKMACSPLSRVFPLEGSNYSEPDTTGFGDGDALGVGAGDGSGEGCGVCSAGAGIVTFRGEAKTLGKGQGSGYGSGLSDGTGQGAPGIWIRITKGKRCPANTTR
jgi:hypothetical protein